MPRFVLVLLCVVLGFVLTAIASYAAIIWLSSNSHDRSMEAAMSAVFVFGPAGALIAGLAAFFRSAG